MAMTAKVVCQSKQLSSGGTIDGEPAVSMVFVADHKDGRNAEWAANTPSLSVSMTVKGNIAARYDVGKSYTLTWTESD